MTLGGRTALPLALVERCAGLAARLLVGVGALAIVVDALRSILVLAAGAVVRRVTWKLEPSIDERLPGAGSPEKVANSRILNDSIPTLNASEALLVRRHSVR
ncbi:hypothetical protein WMF04_34955 [Sorangium sp. So ce260]|uniref:hypothetical protein n=1 Tax=Sorangium sp. So ce260 TaxID=3133291 RepID=UPI003F5FF47F